MVQCELCGKELKNTQGLRGHKHFVHGQTGSNKSSVARVATVEELSRLEERLDELQNITQLLGAQLAELGQSVTEQAGELRKLTDEVSSSKLSSRSSNAGLAKCRSDLEQLSTELARLSRYIQYDVAGIEDDIIWEIAIDRPMPKRKG